MRSLRNCVLLVCLGLVLTGPAVSAVEGPARPSTQEADTMGRIVQNLQAFLKSIWDNEGFDIDPWGRNSTGTAQEAPSNPSPDEGYDIDPWG